ncbi:MAG: M2 family metallopeptidase [Myxococcota bacterium]
MKLRPLEALVSVLLAAAPLPSLAAPPGSAGAAAGGKATPEEAKAFAKQLDSDLRRLWVEASRTDWIKNNFITDDTEAEAAQASEAVLAYTTDAILKATKFDGLSLDPDTKRMLYLLKVSNTLPAPSDAAKRKELADIAAKLTSIYGKGKYCKKDKAGKEECKDLGQLSKVLATSRNYDELLDAWTGWRTISPEMKPMYQKLVSLSNEGAKEIGYQNAGELWRAGYDMKPDEFAATTEKLWSQVRPLYEKLHCYTRNKLVQKYGKDKVPPTGLIPAHLLGNMWSQEWGKIYDLTEPYKNAGSADVSKALQAKIMGKRAGQPATLDDAKQMVKYGESFFTSVGLKPLPDTFWQRSLFVQPKDRDVVCHASAWDVTFSNDLRIKMCIKVDEEDLIVIHHELGHDYYFMNYYTMPVLYQAGANDGFHEAIGDALALSVTPNYLKQIGIIKDVPKNDKQLINLQMKDALEKIAFLPFGLLVDQWRWDVFSGKIQPKDYNAAWWALVAKYQGVGAPNGRTEDLFDAGSKYHIPANVPYMRYFLARILQFQFHRAMCKIAGHTGPLHECSIYGNKAAGEKLRSMLAMGASKPWPDALEALTGQREMDASALVEYFQPLDKWLDEANKGQKCGW